MMAALMLASLYCTTTAAAATMDVTVLIPTQVIGSRTFAAQTADGRAVLVRAYGNDAVPRLSAGDTVRIDGQLKGESRGLPILGTTGKKMTRTGSGDVRYEAATVADVDEPSVGKAMKVLGTVTHAAKHSFSISDESGEKELEVAFPKKIQLPKLALGSRVEVRGVVLSSADGLQLAAVDRESFTIAAPPPPPDLPETDPDAQQMRPDAPVPHPKGTFTAKWIASFVALGLLVAAAFVMVVRRRNRLDEDIWTENR